MMGTKQRDELIERIKNIKDPRVIEEIYRLLEVTVEEESVYVLTDEQKKEIAQAREEINRGEGIPAEDVDKEFDAWLNEWSGLRWQKSDDVKYLNIGLGIISLKPTVENSTPYLRVRKNWYRSIQTWASLPAIQKLDINLCVIIRCFTNCAKIR